MKRLLLVSMLLVSACAPPRTQATHTVVPLTLSPARLDDATALTAELIRAHAVNPPGDEKRVVDVLAARFSAAGIDVDVRPFDGSTRVNLKAVVHGSDPKAAPVLLFAHSDVVPADASEWSTPPFDGALKDGALVGRGAIDMLSMAALETLTLIELHERAQHGDVPVHDVIVVIAGDEEVDGKGIMQALKDWPELAHAMGALTEGGTLLESYLKPGEDLASIAIAEKGLFQFTLTAHGPSGHGSTPLPDAAPDRLLRAVHAVQDMPLPFTLGDVTQHQLRELGASRGGVEGAVLSSPLLVRVLAKGKLEQKPTMRALLHNTCALTMLSAGLKRNVLPPTASATFDCRLLPGTAPTDFEHAVHNAIHDDDVTLTVEQASPASASPGDHAIVDVIRARMQSESASVVVLPILTKGATDCRFVRAVGVPCYGYVPVRLSSDELDAFHGKDERVRTDELKRGLSRLTDITHSLASTP